MIDEQITNPLYLRLDRIEALLTEIVQAHRSRPEPEHWSGLKIPLTCNDPAALKKVEELVRAPTADPEHKWDDNGGKPKAEPESKPKHRRHK